MLRTTLKQLKQIHAEAAQEEKEKKIMLEHAAAMQRSSHHRSGGNGGNRGERSWLIILTKILSSSSFQLGKWDKRDPSKQNDVWCSIWLISNFLFIYLFP